jgi:hypothetical protein
MADPTPQEFGFPDRPTRANVECWTRQEAFLEAYRHTSRTSDAAKAIGVSIYAVNQWVSRDVYQFKKRLEMARLEYCDSIRRIIHERLANPQGNRGSDILLMFEAKAVMPEMYREEVKVLGVSAPLQILDRLRELAAKDLKAQKALEAPAVETEFREVGPTVLPTPPVPDNPGSRAPDPSRLAPPQPPKRPKREPGRVKRW